MNFGDPRLPTRFWQKVRVDENGCWTWTAHKNKNGYGTFSVAHRKSKLAHRLAYETLVGEVPAGLQLDHLCRVRHCCNPAHLEPVTQTTNVNRGISMERSKAYAASITHCPQGHEYTEANTRVVLNSVTGYSNRLCRTCDRQRAARRYAERKMKNDEPATRPI